MEKTGAGDPTKTAEEVLNELLRDAPTEADIWALLPDPEEQTSRLDELLVGAPSGGELMALIPTQEELTATINRLLEEMTADR